MANHSLERRIIIGLIVSTDYISQINKIWNSQYLQSGIAKRLAQWCFEYYDEYEKAPNKDIEGIYFEKISKPNFPKDIAEEIEEDILPGLSDEYEHGEKFNTQYLIDQTKEYFKRRSLELHQETIQELIEEDNLLEAETVALQYTPPASDIEIGLDLGSKESLQAIERAFNEEKQRVVSYPGALGEMWNQQLTRGSLFALMGPEKRGKCLPGNQRILLSDGSYMPLKEVIQTNRKDVISFDESSRSFVNTTISDYWINGKKPVYKITTRTGRSVAVTKNHPFLTPDGWQDLTKIGEGSFIAVPKILPVFGKVELKDEEIKLLAYFITEGCLREYDYKDGKGVYKNISFTSADKDIQKDFSECIKKFNCKAVWKGIDAKVRNSDENKCKHNKNYVLFMLKKHDLWNKLSYDKTIPDTIFQLPKHKLKLFLMVMFTCDGWINRDGGQVGFAVANFVLAEQIQMLLTRFGVVSKLSYSDNDKRGSWCVSIGDSENIVRFCNEIGFMFSKNKKMIKAILNIKITHRSFLDKFPWQIARDFCIDIKKELSSKRIEAGPKSKKSPLHKVFTKIGSVGEQINKKLPLMRQSFIEVKDTIAGDKYFNSPLLWDQIINIEYLGEQDTFDLTINTHHNFIAENILVHNTFWMLDIGIRGVRSKANVAFFQAGDMTENQQLKRICIYLAKKSDQERYCGEILVPVKDCIFNQTDICDDKERECDFGIFDSMPTKKNEFRKELNFEKIEEAMKEETDYTPCHNCNKYHNNGAVYYVKMNTGNPLQSKEAKKKVHKFFNKYKNRFKLSTHVNGTLSIKEIKSILQRWEIDNGFVPDIIIIDYADLLIPNSRMEFRHQQNEIWKGLRGLSQEKHALVVTATQSDAGSYEKDRLSLSNFSEDKRKYAHVTAMYGLNQDKKGKEKKLGLMRINELVIREGEFFNDNEVYVLQSLKQGRPFLGSFK